MATITSRRRATAVEPLELAFDSAAVERLYERNSGRLFGYCVSRLGRREDAEDAVQTTFLHAIGALRRGVVPLVESAWLLGIARNVCLARREAFGRRRRLEAICDPHDLESTTAAPAASPEELMGLADALAKLPERQRRAVLLRDWRGLSYHEIATELEVTHAAVETLIFRGRQTLADLLGEEPRATRRRLGALGNLGSFLTAVKTAFTGGAIAVKVAVAVVAVSSAGLAVGSVDGSSAGASRGDVPRAAETRFSPGGTEVAQTQSSASEPPATGAKATAAVSKPAAGRSSRPRGTVTSKPHASGPAAGVTAADAHGSAAASDGDAVTPATKAAASGEAAGESAGVAAEASVRGVKEVAKTVAEVAKQPASLVPASTPPVPAVSPVAGPIAVPPIAGPPVAVPPVAAPPIAAPALPVQPPKLPVPQPPPPAVPAPPVAVTPPTLPPGPPVSAPVTPPVSPPVAPPAPPPGAPPVPPALPLP